LARRPLDPAFLGFLECFLGRPGDDLLLKVFPDVHEIVAVAGDANDQVPVFFGVFLGVPESPGIHHIELDVVGIVTEIGPDEPSEFLDAVITFKDLGQEFLQGQALPARRTSR